LFNPQNNRNGADFFNTHPCSRELTSSSDVEVQTLRNTAPKGPNVGTALAESDPAARVIVGSSTTWSALAASPKLRAGLADAVRRGVSV
jgi:hypothetical protein